MSTKISDFSNMSDQSLARLIIVGIMVVAGVFALILARQAIAPLDSLATQFVCAQKGDELHRPVEAHQRSNRFGLINRTHAGCWFGPVEFDKEAGVDPVSETDPDLGAEDGTGLVSSVPDDAPMVLAFSDFEPGGLYKSAKLMGLLLQLGAVSAVLRVIGEPLLERFAR